MKSNRKLIAYVIFLGVVAGGVMVAAAAWELSARPGEFKADAALVVLLTGFGWLCSSQRVQNGDSSYIAMGTISQVASILLLPLPLAVLAVGAGKLLRELVLTRDWKWSWRAPIVNVSHTILAAAVAGLAFHALRGDQFIWIHGMKAVLALPALIAMGIVFHTIDVAVVVGAITLSSSDPPTSIFRNLFMDLLMPMSALTFLGITVATVWHYNPVLSVFLSVPAALSVRLFSAVARLRQETVQAVIKMAESIDYRDTGTYEHSTRLADLTKRLSQALGLIPEHVNEIVLASRVHDLGKIGISNDILLKQGPLTLEERRIMEDHPVIGANILASYSAFRSSVEIVKHHHERWDGKGYPAGLRGEEIPIGSRIISVVDAFDSMTEDRPYRKGMSPETAVERLKAAMGTQFDPKICAVFMQMLIEDGTYVPQDPTPELRIVPVEAVSAG